MSLDLLKSRAKTACESRGHKLRAWRVLQTDNFGLAESRCSCCGLQVKVNTEGSMSGPALAIQCVSEKAVA